MKMKRTRMEDCHVADRRLCLPPLVSCEGVSDAHCRKKRSIFRVNLFGEIDKSIGLTPVEPTTITTSFQKSRHCTEVSHPEANDVCSLASSVDSCGDTVCDNDREALSSDADSSSPLRRKVGNYRIVIKWRGARPEARIPHRTELKSYRRTLEEFYGHGPLSWEQEGYLAELRSKLHISNDEHLREDNDWRLVSKVIRVVMWL